MLLKEIVEILDFQILAGEIGSTEIVKGYASDLLSDVLANAGEGCIWVTNQKHQNIVGAATMVNLSAVVIVGGIAPDQNTLEKAEAENIPLLSSDSSLFDVAGKLYEMGLRSC